MSFLEDNKKDPSANKTGMLLCEVSWKTAKTFDIFQQLWKVGGRPLADRRVDINGITYQQCIVPHASVPMLQKKLLKQDAHSVLYLVPNSVKPKAQVKGQKPTSTCVTSPSSLRRKPTSSDS